MKERELSSEERTESEKILREQIILPVCCRRIPEPHKLVIFGAVRRIK